MELTGSHVHLKLREERERETVNWSRVNPEHLALPERLSGEVWVV